MLYPLRQPHMDDFSDFSAGIGIIVLGIAMYRVLITALIVFISFSAENEHCSCVGQPNFGGGKLGQTPQDTLGQKVIANQF